MRQRYPEIEPYAHGLLDVGDRNRLYWEACGNPDGKPALVLHGGPGSGCTPGMRQYFDPAAYRIVLFDQRNCGRSRPHASDPAVSLAANTTPLLLADIERLRAHLGIERWLVFGGSFGCALALAYAQQHTARVSELIVTGTATARRAEVDLLTRGLGGLFPAAFARFLAGVPATERNGSLAAAYSRRLHDPDPAISAQAASNWCDWEEAMLPTSPHNPRYDDPAFRLCFARIVTHYWSNDHFLSDGVLLAEAGRLGPVPGLIIQGSLDLINLLGTPWQLAAAWPGSELALIDDAGHGGSDALTAAIVAATDRFAGPPLARAGVHRGGDSLAGLGTRLRHVLEEMDDDIATVLADLGTPAYRPRFSPVVRALIALGPAPIRDLARAIGVTHSAASQTVAQMRGRELVVIEPGEDARQRVVHLTAKAAALLPKIEAEWAATTSAAAELDDELPFPLADLVPAIAAALARRPFRQRMIESPWARVHPDFVAALASARHAADPR